MVSQKINKIKKGGKIDKIFVYGSLRPDDIEADPWIREACQGLQAQKAILKHAKLSQDEKYTFINLNEDESS